MTSDENGEEAEAAEDTSSTEVQGALEKLTARDPKTVTEMIAMMGMGPMPNPLHQKMTADHISQVLDLAAKHDEREFTLLQTDKENNANAKKSWHRYSFAAFVIILIFLAIILFLFKSKPNVLVPILSGAGGLLGGFLGGFGLAHAKASQ